MPSCYLCGTDIPKGQGYRREVKTGSGTGVSFGRRMRPFPSFRTYYGLRTLCAKCAGAEPKSENEMFREGICIIIASAIAVAIIALFSK